MGTEETREQLQMYNYFRSCIYIFLIIELVMNLPVTSESRATQFVLELLGRFQIFNNVPSCKFIELVCIFITCIGTRAKKSLRFNIRTMVIYPIIVGFSLIIICIVLQHGLWGGELDDGHLPDYRWVLSYHYLHCSPTWTVGRRTVWLLHKQSAVCPIEHRRHNADSSGR